MRLYTNLRAKVPLLSYSFDKDDEKMPQKELVIIIKKKKKKSSNA